MTVQIELTKGYVAIIDEEDDWLTHFKWNALVNKNGKVYAHRTTAKTERMGHKGVLLHRALMSCLLSIDLDSSQLIDHIDNDGLNNRRNNLRLATFAQNSQNQIRKSTNASGFKGVRFVKRSPKKPWAAEITSNGQSHYLGCFATPEEAHKAYCEAALKYHGEFASFK